MKKVVTGTMEEWKELKEELKEELKDLKKEVKATRRCIEKVVIWELRGRRQEAGEEEEEGKRSEESKSAERGSKEEAIRKKVEREGVGG